MSEIYAPGSIAGPQGPVGPAGSAAAVSALSAALMPSFVGRNLYDSAKVTPSALVNAADGTLTLGGQPTDATALLFCPGATSMITNMSVGIAWGCGISLYDANGAFMSTIVPTSQPANAAFALPGTQTYVRFGTVPSWMPAGFAQNSGMVFATITGTAALPGSYQPAGLDTVADVNAKDAVVAANAAAAIAVAVGNVGSALGLFAQTVLPAPSGPNRNAFDPQKALHNVSFNTAGVLTANSGWMSAMVFAPGATQFITNLPIRGSGNGIGICTFDAAGNFLAEISAAAPATDFDGGILNPNAVYPLPGNQTYVGFSYNPGNYGWGPATNGSYWAGSDGAALFLAGTIASPCPASLPAGAVCFGTTGTHVKTASALGCPLDSNVVTGGGTDVTSLLNAFLATASAANPVKLILDGPCLVSGLLIAAAGYTTIEGIGQGSGLFVTGTAGSININGAGAGAYNVAPPARAATAIAVRNFTISAAHGGTAAIFLSNCSNVEVENVLFTGANASCDFMLTIGNASRIAVRGCSFVFGGISHDGIHVDGLCEDIVISDCYFATGDDAIALNAPEGYGGDISRVTVTNCIFDGSLTVMRIYTSLDVAAMPANNVHTVRNVVVSNCTGWVTSVCFNLGITNGGLSATGGPDQLQDLTVSNCTLNAPQGLALLLTPIGRLSFQGVNFIPTTTAAIVNCFFSSVGEIDLSGVRVLRNPSGNAAPGSLVFVYSGVAVDRVSIHDFAVVDEEGSSYAAMPCLLDNSGSVAALRLEAVDMTHIAALVSGAGWGGVALLRGGGVLGTGVPVPDSVMDANALYLSSSAGGALSIKVGGVAKRLTLA